MKEKFRYALNSFKSNEEDTPYNRQIISLFKSEIIDKEKNQFLKLELIKEILKGEDHKNTEKNLVDKIIREKVNINRNILNKRLNQNSYNSFNSYNLTNEKGDYNKNLNSFEYKENEKGTFITKMDFIEKKTLLKKTDKNKILVKSLNNNLINSIKNEMIKKGMVIKKPLSSKKEFKLEQIPDNNFNNFNFHMKIFKKRILKEFKQQIKDYESSKKKLLKNVSEEIANKKEFMTKQIPIYIKGFKKNGKDLFHSRKLYDMQYQNRYRKPSINLEELIQNHNQYSTIRFKKGKIPFYHFLRTVNNPYQNLKVIKKSSNSGSIFIKFNEKGAKRFL